MLKSRKLGIREPGKLAAEGDYSGHAVLHTPAAHCTGQSGSVWFLDEVQFGQVVQLYTSRDSTLSKPDVPFQDGDQAAKKFAEAFDHYGRPTLVLDVHQLSRLCAAGFG